MRDVDAGYGAVRVLHGVSIEVREGETVALLGTNGNGKSTLLKCIMGMVTPEAGEIVLETDGARIDLTRKSTEEIVGLGIALVPEGRGIFGDQSVHDNLMLGALARASGRECNGLAVIASRRRDHPGNPRLRPAQSIQIDDAPTHLEGARRRVIFVLHPDVAAQAARELRPGVLRSGRHDAIDERRGTFQFLQGDG